MKDKKMIFRISFLVILALLVIGVTYAWFVWRAPEDKSVSVTIGQVTINYEDGPDITNNNLIPVSTKEKGIVKDITVSSSSPTSLFLNLYLNVKSISDYLKEDSFKWAIYNGDSVITEGNFSSVINGNDITLLDGVAISSTPTTYTLYIWIDGNMNNPNDMFNQSFDYYLHADASNEKPPTGADTITDVYTMASKTQVTNDNINYNYAMEVGMMEDVGGNIRYYGADPNNYVSFNNELWRIIGVFKDIDDGTGKKETRIKIARSESIGNYAWDTNGSNEWSTATLNTYLNGTYLTGLTAEAQNMIGNSVWQLGGTTSSSIYADDFYTFERGAQVYTGRSTTWAGKLSLMYPSDYMYAGDLSKCGLDGLKWETDLTNCRDTSWLRNINTFQWTLTPSSASQDLVFGVNFTGSGLGHKVSISLATRPVLYLKSNVQIIGGDGSQSSPYQISL